MGRGGRIVIPASRTKQGMTNKGFFEGRRVTEPCGPVHAGHSHFFLRIQTIRMPRKCDL
jgi:hypothetical protein